MIIMPWELSHHRSETLILFIIFWRYWGLNSWLLASEASIPPLEPCHTPSPSEAFILRETVGKMTSLIAEMLANEK